MTSPEGRRDRAMPVRLELRRPEAGTLLGALAWVLGALQIMRDRGRFADDAEFEQIYERIAPRIERLVDQVAKAREGSMTRPEFEEGVESAYTEVREAFEAWIRLTAIDTLGAAVAAHGDGDLEEFADLLGVDDPDEEASKN
ncbi:MAG: hypothetical protein CVU47_07780 [Chloroflexi bacterium HGW-Chloroflexi-9]|nr:MAG: hypothetical protein CVU47_07780 [Chloroflexi bacterium HGW-Chloroflexi-9]